MSATPALLDDREAPATRSVRPAQLRVAGLAADAALVVGCVLWATRLSAGMDVSWDLIAYHHYYSWLFSEGLMHLADPEPYVNRYQNPLAQLPWYLLDRSLSPRVSSGAVAALAAGNLLLVRRITAAVVPDRVAPTGRTILGVTAAMVAATGAVFSMELGMSAGDVVVSLPMLAAVLLLVRSSRSATATRQLWLLAAAGALGGASVGMKLTMAGYLVALGLAALVVSVGRRRVGPVLATAAGGVVGLAVSSGWWFVQMWRLTGSPVFPFYNTVFHSPWFGDFDVRDTRFGAHGVIDALTYPWLMAEGTTRVLDVPMRDPRWAVLTALLLLAGVVAGALFLRGGRRREDGGSAEARLSFWVFMLAGGLLWLFQFGIARYAVTNELLTGTAFVLALGAVLRRAVLTAGVALALSLAMAPFNVGHFHHVPFKRDRFMVQAGPLDAVPSDSVVVAVNSSAPSGFLLEHLRPGTRRHVYQDWFAGSGLLRDLRSQQLATAPHVYLVLGPSWPNQPAVRKRLQANLGLVVDDARCQPVHSTLPVRHLCPARYVGASGQ
ncbi:hypothetical protein ABEG17_03335 [Pedococcus sp. KACC 23699]|uniref:DUF2029 domain-containing protein n=1 Tax=Pedococcus sp. KACC 23699 TaxID=3149228 RepID=A0AAU7JVV0_9MICO